MNLVAVWAELATRLRTIEGIRAYDAPTDKITVPGNGAAAVPLYPEAINFDQTYGRGTDEIEQQVVLTLADPTTPRTAKRAAEYAAGAGNKSIKECLETGGYTSCDLVVVTRAEFDVYTMAGVPHLVGIFNMTITGPGA